MSGSLIQWQWKSDDSWVDYDDETNYYLELAHQRGELEIGVDGHRLVDFKHMMQRRFDDRKKRRPVQRLAQIGFKRKLIRLRGPFDEDQYEHFLSEIAGSGGLVASNVCKAIDVVVVNSKVMSIPFLVLFCANSLLTHTHTHTHTYTANSLLTHTHTPHTHHRSSKRVMTDRWLTMPTHGNCPL